ncbi:30S ribosomal protein S8 [Salmonella enterica subsp. enterica]|nr:30S ribosomal protein S8 [Salmonella enterica subsp. enterica]
MSMQDPIADMLTRIRNGQGREQSCGHHAFLQAESGNCQRAEGRRFY